MVRKNFITALFILYAAIFVFAAGEVRAQSGSVAAAVSEITQAPMPKGAERILPESVPAEFNQAFDDMLRQGAGKLISGEREVLAWAGNYKTATNVAQSIAKMKTNFQTAGWTYEPQGRSGELEVFMLVKAGAPRRVVLGFFVPADEALVCALMEVLLPDEKSTVPQKTGSNRPVTSETDSSAKIVNVDADTQWINVMGNEMPAMPQFPNLAPKPGRVRGYVRDWTGKPLAGAELGVRSSYLAGYYSGAQGKTDANGYYEIVVPRGSAHFYNAGYQIEWGGGLAAVSLHPADGKLDSFVTTDGAVENFVMLPYGITSRENLQENSHLPSTFYGGALFLGWYSVAADDNNAPAFAVRAGGTLEVVLKPEGAMLDGSAGRTIIIRKTLGISGSFRIHNIPLGRYRITVRANGRPLKIADNKKYDPLFGMTPVESTGDASILFTPESAKASSPAPQYGGWKWIDIGVSTP
jgi:hypothetical protein